LEAGSVAILTANRLAWLEIRLILTKLLYKFDIELVDKDLDWYGESYMEMVWNTPPLKAVLKARGV
jgi:cytochrome P450